MKKVIDRPPHGSGSGTPCQCDGCREKRRLASARYYARHKEQRRADAAAYMRERRVSHPERVAELAMNTREKYGNRRYNMRRLERKHGLTADAWEEMFSRQDGKCAICSKSFRDTKDTHVDHCHERQHVRGLLCSNCNLGIGMFKDSPTALRAAASYLEVWTG